jgi:hypothetical protein
LQASLPRLKAQRLLDEYHAGKCTPGADELFDAAMLTTGSETLANAYRVSRMQADRKPTG